ncbi:MAG TPA: response regulator [Candidatus Limnocylindria bacterium]|nr:response regulator [Candidatus Limnocylindria bacterium]
MPSKPKVLVVDDELGVRESLRAILSQDCDVVTAASGAEALRIVGGEQIALVTLDLRMPGMSGIEVLEASKRLDPDIEALIITGYGSFDTAVQGLRHRAFDYLAKPFDATQVRATVQAALARRATTQKLRTVPDSILATLSHEFRTPLNVIMGYSSMLADDSDRELSAEQRAALDRIQSNSTTLLQYVETLFYLIELERGLVSVTPQPTDVQEVVDRLRQELAPRAAAKGLALEVSVEPGCTVDTDSDMLGRLLFALTENAVRHTANGRVVLSASGGGTAATFIVRDTGEGLDPVLARELEQLAGAPELPPPGILGFGLRLIGRLVRELHGTVTVESGEGGTAITVKLPALVTVELPRVA